MATYYTWSLHWADTLEVISSQDIKNQYLSITGASVVYELNVCVYEDPFHNVFILSPQWCYFFIQLRGLYKNQQFLFPIWNLFCLEYITIGGSD